MRRLTYTQAVEARLGAALDAVRMPRVESAALRAGAARLMRDWGDHPVGDAPPVAYFAANDSAPFECSFAWTREDVEVRFGCQNATAGTDARQRHEAMKRLTRDLGNAGLAQVARYLRIEDLFDQAAPPEEYAVGHVVAVRPGAAPSYKMYLNPRLRGSGRALESVDRAMERLGLWKPWSRVRDELGDTDLERNLAVVGLDLADTADARVKVYLNRPGCSAAELQHLGSLTGRKPTVRMTAIWERMRQHADGSGAPGGTKSPMASYAFTSASDLPASMTFYLPLDPCLPHDVAAGAVTDEVMESAGIDPAPHHALLEALTDGPSTHRRSLSWLGYQEGRLPRVNVYVCPELYR